jgi:hypothetical protein
MSQSAPVSTPAPVPWAFDTAYRQPLPARLQLNPHTGFGNMVDYMQTLPAQYPGSSLKVCPVVATYPNGAVKKGWVQQPTLSDAEKSEYARGATTSGAAKGWTQGGTVGVVTSSMSDAVSPSTGSNDWHTVAMARHGNKVWVHDPAYSAAAHAGNVHRIDGVSGGGMVHKLVHQWPQVEGAFFQGRPVGSVGGHGQLECMGRSAQWVEATVAGTLPWPPNHDPSGGTWTWHYRN